MDVVTLIESIIHEVLLKYGDRAIAVLRAAYEVMEEYAASGKKVPGHFDFRGVINKLNEWGMKYNPSQLLRIMERDYGIIETAYRTATQRWYVFTDVEAVRNVLSDFGSDNHGGIEDPEAYVLELQIAATGIDTLYSRIKQMSRKGILSPADKEYLRHIVFNDLTLIAKVMKEAMKYGNKYKDFIVKAATLLQTVRSLLVGIKTQSGHRATEIIVAHAKVSDVGDELPRA